MKKYKCPRPGCESDVSARQFIREAGLARPGTWVRKPLAVLRAFSAICPIHGKVTMVDDGHHVNDDTVEYEANEEWQSVAFAVMMLHESD
jgi:hypothetical protein